MHLRPADSRWPFAPRDRRNDASEDATPTPDQLTLEVYTTPGRPIVSATKSEGPGDIPMWSPSSATLIYGEHDAVLVDVPATFDQTDALADWVESKRRRLTHIYITHGHGDHWLGLARMIQRFPGATGLATAEVLARVEFEAGPGMAGYWEGIFPGEVPRERTRCYRSSCRTTPSTWKATSCGSSGSARPTPPNPRSCMFRRLPPWSPGIWRTTRCI